MNQQAVSRRSEIVDIFLFFVLSAFTAIFAISGYFKSSPFPEQFSFLCQHFHGILNLLMVVCLLIYVFLFLFFIQRRYLKTGRRISPWLISLFLLFVLFRAVTDFSSPYHPFEEVVRSPFHPLDYTLQYDGIPMADRIVNFLCETAVLSFCILPFTYLKEMNKSYLAKFFLAILFALAALGLVATLYSFMTEWNEILFNIKLFFFRQNDTDHEFCLIKSFTTHKNVFGYFLWSASISLFLLSVYQQKFKLLNLILMIYFLFFCIIIKTRFPMALTAITILFYLLYMAIDLRRKAKGFSIFCFSVLGCLFLSILFLLTIGKDCSISRKIISLFQDFSEIANLLGRKDLWKRAICLINSPFHLFFGYGKEQYIYFFDQSGLLMGREIVDLCHNGFIDILVSYGILGLLPVVLLHVVLIEKDIRLILKKNWRSILYLFLFITITSYGFVESRVLLGLDGSSFFIFLLLMMPTMIDDAFYTETKSNDIYRSIAMKDILLRGIH